MKYPRYPVYRESGVQWLGEIPAHWEVKRLKYLADCFGGGTPDKSKDQYWTGNIPWVSPKDMSVSAIHDSEDHISEEGLRESATRLIPTNSVLVVVRSGILRHTIPVAINKVPVSLNQDLKALVSKEILQSRYLAYFIVGLNKALLVDCNS